MSFRKILIVGSVLACGLVSGLIKDKLEILGCEIVDESTMPSPNRNNAIIVDSTMPIDWIDWTDNMILVNVSYPLEVKILDCQLSDHLLFNCHFRYPRPTAHFWDVYGDLNPHVIA